VRSEKLGVRGEEKKGLRSEKRQVGSWQFVVGRKIQRSSGVRSEKKRT
jgi:hypothetical protein